MLNYEENIQDRSPCVRAAGLLTHGGGRVSDCLALQEPGGPYGFVKRFLKPNIYPVGETTRKPIPMCIDCVDMRHGVKTIMPEPEDLVEAVVNPPNTTHFQTEIANIEEKRAGFSTQPLGKIPNVNLPKHVQPYEDIMGRPTERGITAGELINPPMTAESEYPLPGYPKTDPKNGTAVKVFRKYNSHFNPQDAFGQSKLGLARTISDAKDVITQSVKTGPKCLSSIYWEHQNSFAPRVGQVLDPNCDTRCHLSPDHTFGVSRKSDSCMADVLREHSRDIQRSRDMLITIYRQLKSHNFMKFDRMEALAQFFDRGQTGYVAVKDMWQVCEDVRAPIDYHQLRFLASLASKTASLNFVHYGKFLQILDYRQMLTKGWIDCMFEKGVEDRILEDLRQELLGRNVMPRKRPPPVPLNESPTKFTADHPHGLSEKDVLATTSRDLSEEVGKIKTQNWPTAGMPTLRSAHPVPNNRRISDFTNYGEQDTVCGRIWQSVLTNAGVTKEDLLKARTKQEMWRIMNALNVQVDCDAFGRLCDLARQQTPDGTLNVHAMREVMKKIKSGDELLVKPRPMG